MSKEPRLFVREAHTQPQRDATLTQEGGQAEAPPTFQLLASNADAPANPPESPAAPNETGMPDQLKMGIEQLSGQDMSDVKVHYNSSKPAQLQAHAFAQGPEIHLAAGQEKHLAHEAWHVVQQKQGRVQANKQLKGVAINDNINLEQEADIMGAKAMQFKGPSAGKTLQKKAIGLGVVQRIVVQVILGKEENKVEEPIETIGKIERMDAVDVDGDHSMGENENQEETEAPMDIDNVEGEGIKNSESDVDMEDSYKKDTADTEATDDLGTERRDDESTDLDVPVQYVINQVKIAGRPKSPYSGTMGDHTTAFGVHVKGLQSALKGKTLVFARDYMKDLFNWAIGLPGMKILPTTTRENSLATATNEFLARHNEFAASLSNADSAARSLGLLQNCIEKYLEFRELIPLSTINIKEVSAYFGKGHGEASPLNKLNLLNSEGMDLNGREDELMEAAIGTFDADAVAITIMEGTNPEMQRRLFGGDFRKSDSGSLGEDQVPDLNEDEVKKMFVNQHILSLENSFPNAMRSCPDIDKVLLDHINNRVEIRAMADVVYYGERLQVFHKAKNSTATTHQQRNKMEKGNALSPFKKEIRGLMAQVWDCVVENEDFDLKRLESWDSMKELLLESREIETERNTWPHNTSDFKTLLVAFVKDTEILEEHESRVKRGIDILGVKTNFGKKKGLKDCDNLFYLSQCKPFTDEIKKLKKKISGNDIKRHTQEERKSIEKAEKEAIKQDSHAVALELDNNNSIQDINFAGRPESPFGNKMGAHTTAWVVYEDWIRNELEDCDLDEAIEKIAGEMLGEMEAKAKEFDVALKAGKNYLPESARPVIPRPVDQNQGDADAAPMSELEIAQDETLETQNRLADKKTLLENAIIESEGLSAEMKASALQDIIHLFMSYINFIPGVTLDAVKTTGNGEGNYRKTLNNSGGNLAKKNQARDKLFDFQAENTPGKEKFKDLHDSFLDNVYGLSGVSSDKKRGREDDDETENERSKKKSRKK